MTLNRKLFLFLHIFTLVFFVNFYYILDLYSISEYYIYLLVTFFLLLLFLFFINLFLYKPKIVIDSIVTFIFIFGFYTVLSAIYVSPVQFSSNAKVLGFSLSLFLVFIPYLMNYRIDDFKKIVNIYIYILFIVAILMFVEFLISNDSALLSNRLQIGDINPIWTGRIFGEVIILLLLFFKKGKLFKYFLILILLIGMISTGSKGPLFSLIISLFVIYIFPTFIKKRYVKKGFIKRYFIMVFLILIGFIFVRYIVLNIFDINTLLDRFLISNSEEDYGANSRIVLFSVAWEFFKDAPLFGNGFGSFSLLYTGFQSADYPHNIFLEALSELGIIGFILLLIPIIITIIKYLKYRRPNVNNVILNLFMTLFLYYLLNSLVSGELGFYNNKLFLFMGLLNYYIILLSKSNKMNLQKSS